MKYQTCRHILFISLLLVAIVVLVRCTSKTNNGNAAAGTSITENTSEGIVSAHAGFADSLTNLYTESVNSGNLDAYMDLWADNATRYVPDTLAITGKNNIRASMEPGFTNNNMVIVINNVGTVRFGNWADIHGTFKFSSSPKSGGEMQTSVGKYSTLLVKDHGAWKIYLECYNYDEPPTVK